MKRFIQIILGILTSFVALTAIGGGTAILTEFDKFPIEWLDGTPFRSYVIPAFLLIILVGGSALFAAINIIFKEVCTSLYINFRNSSDLLFAGRDTSFLNRFHQDFTPIEIFYLIVGIILIGLALLSNSTLKF
ncbi:MAG: hypothetical protein MZV63_28310 [Marinilabiliales bacterium]|nr:hypothetical protein [Marinilabiliales bacterium]